ncbi:MAG TPA: hypothetical protein DDZ36_02805 [Deltaproteobacteria bacterium]|nr:hypothetical protein [Deltaproteobacteria bacterium]
MFEFLQFVFENCNFVTLKVQESLKRINYPKFLPQSAFLFVSDFSMLNGIFIIGGLLPILFNNSAE